MDVVEVADEVSVASIQALGEDGVPVGSARILAMPLHQTAYHLEIEVDVNHRRQGIGRLLVEAILEQRPEPRPLGVKVVEGTVEHAFFEHLGGVVYQDCPPSTLDVGRPDVRQWLDELSDAPTVRGSALTTERLFEGWVDMYEWVHVDWSPISGRAAAFREFDREIRDELDRDASRFVVDGSRIVAGVFVFGSDDPTDPVDAVAETMQCDEPDGTAALATCLRAVMTDQRANGRSRISFDCHETDPHLMPLLRSAPHLDGARLVLGHVI